MPSTSLHRQSAIDGWPVRKAKPLHQLPRLIPTPRVLRSEGRPISMTSTQVTKKNVPGTVLAAECCYGTRLYDPSLRGIPDPVCIAYLTAGALGFLGICLWSRNVERPSRSPDPNSFLRMWREVRPATRGGQSIRGPDARQTRRPLGQGRKTGDQRHPDHAQLENDGLAVLYRAAAYAISPP